MQKTRVVRKGLWHPLVVLMDVLLHILLQTIDRLKAAAAPLVQADRDAAALAALSAPRIWRLPDGRSVEVALPETLRARELAAAHAALAAADGSNLDARLAALLAAKYHAKAVDCRCGWRAGWWVVCGLHKRGLGDPAVLWWLLVGGWGMGAHLLPAAPHPQPHPRDCGAGGPRGRPAEQVGGWPRAVGCWASECLNPPAA